MSVLDSLRLLAPDAPEIAIAELRPAKTPGDAPVMVYQFFDTADAAAAYVDRPQASTVIGTFTPLNRFEKRARRRGEGVSAEDITRRVWLLIDLDPVRDADTNATDEQKAAALTLARTIADFLTHQGWPESVMADSGNGAHLLACIDLPATPESTALVTDILTALGERFDTSAVEVDLACASVARLTKVYGSWVRKGPHEPTRPHRRSTILSQPRELEAVPLAKLQQVAASRAPHPPGTAPGAAPDADAGLYSLDTILTALAPYHVAAPRAKNGYVAYEMDCAWRAEHTTGPRGAMFSWAHGGIPGFSCQHEHCKAKRRDWAQLRDLLQLQPDTALTHRRAVLLAVERLRITREANRVLDAEARGAVVTPAPVSLRDLLTEPDPDSPWLLDGLQPRDSRVVLAAPYKSGKTSLVANLVRSLLDGEPFLGQYEPAPLTGCVVLLDFEMSRRQLKHWYRDQGITQDDRLVILPMRGAAASFDLRDPDVLAAWVTRLRALGASYLVLDCLRPVLDALGLDENHDTGRLLTPLDVLLVDSGCLNCLLVHHMGHSEERSRGDSRLRDWPDVEWRVVRKDANPASARFFVAFGRDVDVPEQQLGFDPATRRLTVIGGSRSEQAAQGAVGAVLAFVAAENGHGRQPTQNQIVEGLKVTGSPYSVRTLLDAIRRAIGVQRLTVTGGKRGAKQHQVAGDRRRVSVDFTCVVLPGERGPIDSVRATCRACQHQTESFGMTDKSYTRCLAPLAKECPRGEKNFYVDAVAPDGDDPPIRDGDSGDDPPPPRDDLGYES